MKFCEVSRNLFSNRCWKFQLSILKNKKVLFLKKYNLGCSLKIGQESSNRWRFTVPIFREGFVHNHPKKYHLLRFYALTGTKKSSGFYAFQKNINFVMIYYEIQQLMEMLFIAGLIIIHPLGCTLNKIPLAFRFIWKQNHFTDTYYLD